MKIKIENCYYDLIKDLLLSLDSLVIDVKKEEEGIIITLKDQQSESDFLKILNQEPLHQITQNASISFL